MNLMLYVSTVLIWGSTWIAIAWQLGPIPIEVSVLYRFALAALALFALLTVSGKFPRLPWAGQRYAALLGALLFSTNFLCFYHATLYIPSGLSAVIFASASIFNGLNLWLFEGKRPGMRWLQGSLLGLMGTLLLFWPVLADAQLGANGWKGLLFACAGTLCFSLGNLVSARGQRQGYHVLQMVPWGMVYGVALLLGWVTVLGQSLTLPTDPRTAKPIPQLTSGKDWQPALDLIENHVAALAGLAKPPREALATEIKKRLGQHFKIEGKAEKAMKEKLAAVRGQ
mgnify:CR=1 FL=1